MGEKTYVFHWIGGRIEEGKGYSVSDAFMKLGYGGGAMNALDWYEEKAE